MGKYRFSFVVDVIELEKTNLFPPNDYPMRPKISIDINAKYVFEAAAIFQDALTAIVNGQTYIPVRMSDEHYTALDNKIISPIISEVAAEEDTD